MAPAVSQQLALARLLLADPHTLILDEATSLLDSSAARDLEESLSSVLKGRTVIVIAHQLTAARNADRIAVMDGGRIVELGNHDELMASNGSYAQISLQPIAIVVQHFLMAGLGWLCTRTELGGTHTSRGELLNVLAQR